jgi:hypothetical protein
VCFISYVVLVTATGSGTNAQTVAMTDAATLAAPGTVDVMCRTRDDGVQEAGASLVAVKVQTLH